MHRHHAVLDLLEEGDGIESSHERVRRIVLDAEVRRIGQRIEQRQERRLLLRELRVAPLAVLVVVLEAEHHVALAPRTRATG